MKNKKELRELIKEQKKEFEHLEKLFEEMFEVKIDELADNEDDITIKPVDRDIVIDLASLYYKLAYKVEQLAELSSNIRFEIYSPLRILSKIGFDKIRKEEFEKMNEVANNIDEKLRELYSLMSDIQGNKSDRRLIGEVLAMAEIPVDKIIPYEGLTKNQSISNSDMKISDIIIKLEKIPTSIEKYGPVIVKLSNELGNLLINKIKTVGSLKFHSRSIIVNHNSLTLAYANYVINLYNIVRTVHRVNTILASYRRKLNIKDNENKKSKNDSLSFLKDRDPELYELLE